LIIIFLNDLFIRILNFRLISSLVMLFDFNEYQYFIEFIITNLKFINLKFIIIKFIIINFIIFINFIIIL